jgi:glyoxylase I family protein
MGVPFGLTALDHLVLRCADQERMVRFYCDVLGCTEERRLEAIGLIQLRAGRSLVDLVPADVSRDPTAANLEHFCLATDVADVEVVVGHLRAHGVELIGDPMTRYGAEGFGPSIYCRDPERNVVELKCAPPTNAA